MTLSELFAHRKLAGHCLACGDDAAEPLLRLQGIPVLVTELCDDPQAARDVPRGDLDLVLCRGCGLVWNSAFDSELVDYTPAYENSLHHSPTFQQYAEQLAARLVADHGLAGRPVAEVGCGRGDFLVLLCRAGAVRGIGFDPSADPPESPPDDVDVTIEPRYYRGAHQDLHADLVCARHVLEHVDDPVGFLQQLQGVTPVSDRPLVAYLEVPNADFVFSRSGMWDLIYQHVTYFAPAALQQVAHQAGFTVARLERSFDGQFLGVDALAETSPPLSPSAGEAAPFVARARRFPELLCSTVQRWRQRLAIDGHAADTVLWGAGAKGATFCNLVDPDRRIAGVVDLNPRKWRRYVPGTGHRIIAPAELVAAPPHTIVVANPTYRPEIRRMVADLGLASDIIAI